MQFLSVPNISLFLFIVGSLRAARSAFNRDKRRANAGKHVNGGRGTLPPKNRTRRTGYMEQICKYHVRARAHRLRKLLNSKSSKLR